MKDLDIHGFLDMHKYGNADLFKTNGRKRREYAGEHGKWNINGILIWLEILSFSEKKVRKEGRFGSEA